MKEVKNVGPLDEILSKYRQNRLKIGDVLKHKEEIEKIPDNWMYGNGEYAFDRSKSRYRKFFKHRKGKVDFFVKVVEDDKKFTGIINAIKNQSKPFIPDHNYPYCRKLFESLSKTTSGMEVFLRYVSLIYVGLKIGIKCLDRFNNLIDVIGCYRIGMACFEYPGRIVEAFSLQKMYTYWDEEMALCKPIKIENGKPIRDETPSTEWDIGLKGWSQIIDCYLLEKNAIEIPVEKLSFLWVLLSKDSELNSIHADILPNLKSILDIDDVFAIDLEKLKNLLEILKEYKSENGLVGDNWVAFIHDFSGPHKTRGWDVKISCSILQFFRAGQMYRYEFDNYFEYEDFPGGKTFNYPKKMAVKVVSVDFENDNSKIKVEMKNGERQIIEPEKTEDFKRFYQQGKREKEYNRFFELFSRLKYEGNPGDLNFKYMENQTSY